jgi:hypothetical protein
MKNHIIPAIVLGLFVAAGQSPAATVTPSPAVFGNLLSLDDTQFAGNEIDTGLLTYPQPSTLQQTYTPLYGGSVTLASRSSVAVTGAPFVTAQVDADYLGLYGVTGSAASSLSYQVVLTGGTPGTLTPVNFGTFGQLTNTSGCTACPNDSFLSASALLRIVDHNTGTNYFQLGGSTDSIFQTGLGTTPISIFTTLNLPIDVALDVIIGVRATGYTQQDWMAQAIGPVTSYAFLDPTFVPQTAGITVLQSSNLIAPVPLPATLLLFVSGLLTLPLVRFGKFTKGVSTLVRGRLLVLS